MVVTFLIALFQAIAAIPALLGYVEKFSAAVALWFFQNARNKDLQAIADAAALQARAKTDADRYAAADAWQKALSRDRVISI